MSYKDAAKLKTRRLKEARARKRNNMMADTSDYGRRKDRQQHRKFNRESRNGL